MGELRATMTEGEYVLWQAYFATRMQQRELQQLTAKHRR